MTEQKMKAAYGPSGYVEPRPPFSPCQLWRSKNPVHHGWCKHGIFQIENIGGTLLAVDTYWGSLNSDSHRYTVSRIASDLEFMIDTEDATVTHRENFNRYADCDRAYIPIGGSGERYFVRKGATPDKDRNRAQLEEKVRSLESDIRFATGQLADAKRELAALSL